VKKPFLLLRYGDEGATFDEIIDTLLVAGRIAESSLYVLDGVQKI
jgi:hypothetical protein